MNILNRLGMIESVETLLAQERRMSQVANNLANVDTAGYKKEKITFWEMLYSSSYGPRVGKALKPLVDQGQGPTKGTGNPLHVAINGDGFFRIQTPRGIRYTRDGNFHRNVEGQLTTANGDLVLGQGGTIAANGERIDFSKDGTVFVNGQQLDRLAIVSFEDLAVLEKEGQNLFKVKNDEGLEQAAEAYTIQQGFLEASNVNTVSEMAEMMDLVRNFEAQQKVIQALDDLDDQAVTRVGKLTG